MTRHLVRTQKVQNFASNVRDIRHELSTVVGRYLRVDTEKSQAARSSAEVTVKRLIILDENPFECHFFDSLMGAIHFVHEGDCSPLLMLHGNPTWSFPYRKFIQTFAPTHSAVAPDHIGFGLWDKPVKEASHSIEGIFATFRIWSKRSIFATSRW